MIFKIDLFPFFLIYLIYYMQRKKNLQSSTYIFEEWFA